MPSKKEISDKINTILGTKIDFTVLTKEDLDQLTQVFTSGRMLTVAVKGLRQHARSQVMDQPLSELLKRSDDKGGLFGLGILPIKPIMPTKSSQKEEQADEHS